jgi:hypothetical protein
VGQDFLESEWEERIMPQVTRWAGLSICLWAMAWIGCSYGPSQPDYASLGLVQISGTVTLDGRPLPGAAVYFHDRPNRRYSYGVTDAEGRYSLMLDSRMAGVMPGQKEVEITTLKNPAASPVDGPAEAGSEGDDEGDQGGEGGKATTGRKEQVPSKYNTETTLKFEVTTSDSAVNFDLTTR